MRQKVLILTGILIAAILSGCVSVSVVEKAPNMVEVANSGCYLFYVLPVLSGDIRCPNQQEPVIFKNTVTLENNMRLLDWAAKKSGAVGYENVVSHLEEERILFLLLKRKTLHTSAEFRK